jgi:tRNA(Ile)-lysidine synthase
MQQQVLKTIARFRMILPGQRIAAACSGGPDSTALLLLLHQLSSDLGCVLSACHFNHRLRGEESDQDERFVRELADRLGLDFHLARADVRRAAESAGANLEAKARELRYAFFHSLVDEGQADRIAVGHTADDQAETVIQRLLRGSGTRGLAGIYPVVGERIIRPLLEARRSEIVDWLEARGQTWREDPSNRDLRLSRNRIRHELLPALHQFNPHVVETLAGTAEITRDEESFWQLYLPAIVSQTARVENEKVVVEIGRLREIHPAVARRVLRWALGRAAQGSRIPRAAVFTGEPEQGEAQAAETALPLLPQSGELEQIQRLLHLAFEGQSGGSLSLPGKLEATREFSHLIIQRSETRKEFPAFLYQVRVPGTVEVPEIGSSFSFEIVPIVPEAARYNGSGSYLLDQRLGGFLLTLRNWQPGDGYKPKGHRTHRKLKELFRKKRVAASERPGWPVVVAENQIVWVRGMEPAEEFAPRPGSRQAILLRENRDESRL